MTINTNAASWPQRPLACNAERPKNFVFYDLETTGLNRDYDQITQIAAIRTDADFNIVDEERHSCNIRCRRLPWIVPDPAALLTTRTDPVALDGEAMLPQEALVRLAKLFEASGPAVFIGYNTLRFDEEFLRRGFFSALQNPYLTQTNGNMRADLMIIAHAIHAIQPDRIQVPVFADGEGNTKRSFRLTALAKANGITFDESEAHDALADVRVTIALAKVLRQAAPEVFEFILNNANKWTVIEALERSSRPDADTGAVHPLAQLAVIGGKTKAAPIMGLFPSSTQPGRIITVDLSLDPDRYLGLSEEELVAFIQKDRWRFPAVKPNAQPILLPVAQTDIRGWNALRNALPEAFTFDADWCAGSLAELVGERMRQVIDAGEAFRTRLAAALAHAQTVYPEPIEIEQQLYRGGFISRQDTILAARIAGMPMPERAAQAQRLSDPRLREHVLRWVFAAEPDALPEAARQCMDALVQARLLGPADQPWRTIAKARDELLRLTLEQTVDQDRELTTRLNRIALWLHELEQQTLRSVPALPALPASARTTDPDVF